LVSNTVLFAYLNKHHDITVIVKSILRTYGGIFDQEVKINTVLIANKASTIEDKVIETLIKLEKDDIISLQLTKTDAEITFLEPREDDKTINRIARTIEQQNELKTKQVTSVLKYTNNSTLCKSKQLLSYFGETKLEDCGICSVCISTNDSLSEIELKEKIKVIISVLNKKPLSSREIIAVTEIGETEITIILTQMLEQNLIEITSTNCYKLKKNTKL
jgi:ATP-dependent DNA helicase RecQ